MTVDHGVQVQSANHQKGLVPKLKHGNARKPLSGLLSTMPVDDFCKELELAFLWPIYCQWIEDLMQFY